MSKMITPSLLALMTIVQVPEQSPAPRPGELLQARSCDSARPNYGNNAIRSPNGRLVSLEAMPPCLAGIMIRLAEDAKQVVRNREATAVLQVRVGRGYSESALMFSSPDDPQIHYEDDLTALTDILSFEWAAYRSPDGDLGWSGFVLVIDKGGAKIRLSTSPEPPLGMYETSLELESEFFPDKQLAVKAGTAEPDR